MVRHERIFLAMTSVAVTGAIELTLNDWFRMFGKQQQDRAIDESKRGAPGPQRVFIPYIFKRSYDPEETSLGAPSSTDYDQFDYGDNQMEQWDNDFNFDMPMKRGASQYYLLHFGMPGTSRRTPKSPPSLGSGRIQYGKRGDDFWSQLLNIF